MDTSTHIIMGVTLGGLAHLDPMVSNDPTLAQAVLTGTIVGSNAPDFDYFIKLFKGNGMYIEHHRGLSHSLPFLLIWSLLITSFLYMFFPSISVLHLFFWISLSVVIHVVVDIFNPYGTQAGRPITKKWLSLNAVPLFDPYLFLIHLIGIAFWIYGYQPKNIFTFVYGISLIYFIYRLFLSYKIKQFIAKSCEKYERIVVIPTMRLNVWNFIVEGKEGFEVGKIDSDTITWLHYFPKHNDYSTAIQIAMNDKNVRHFLANSDCPYPVEIQTRNGIEVRFIDLRFRNKNHYPYMAVVLLNKNYTIQSSYTGWIHHTNQIPKYLNPVAIEQ